MSWFRVDDKFAFHRKVVQAGNAAIGVWVRLGAWCSDQMTDGFLPDEIAQLIEGKDEGALAQLLRIGLLELDGKTYHMHDFLDWNPSAKHVNRKRKELSQTRSKAGGKGAKARWQKDGPSPSPSPSPSPDPRREEEDPPTPLVGKPSKTVKARKAAKPPPEPAAPLALSPAELATVAAIGDDVTLVATTRNVPQLARDLVRVAPLLSVAAEIPKAGAWCRANPRNHRPNGNAFLVNWIGKAQADAAARGVSLAPPPPEPRKVPQQQPPRLPLPGLDCPTPRSMGAPPVYTNDHPFEPITAEEQAEYEATAAEQDRRIAARRAAAEAGAT